MKRLPDRVAEKFLLHYIAIQA